MSQNEKGIQGWEIGVNTPNSTSSQALSNSDVLGLFLSLSCVYLSVPTPWMKLYFVKYEL